MGKVNLRNRLRENFNEDSNSDNDISADLITETDTTSNPKTINTAALNQMDADHPEKTGPVNSNNENIITKENISPSESSFSNGKDNVEAENQLFGEQDKKEIKKNFQAPPRINRRDDSLFKDEILEDKKFKSIFNGTKKLFQKKDENIGMKKNLFDRLNINKKMFYTATLCAAVASILIISYLNSFTSTRLFGSEMVYVLVANKNITEKSSITISDLARKEIPKKFVIPNAIILDSSVDPNTFVGQIALTDIYENEQIITKRLVKQEDSPWLSPAVPVNHRAFTIASKALSYIKPKDHVDVLISFVDPLDKSRTINTAVLQDALVLAVDGNYKITAADPPTTGDTVTIAVPNKLINFFTVLQEKGNFQLALRREGDTTNLDTRYSIAQLEVMLNATDVRLEKFKPEPMVFTPPKPQPKPKEVYVPQPQYEAPVYIAPRPVYIPPRPKPRVRVVTTKPQVKSAVPVKEAPRAPTTVFVINGGTIDTQTAHHKDSKP